MNTNRFRNSMLAALAGLALASTTAIGWAQTTNNPNTFDTSDSVKSFVTWWGLNPGMTWDGTVDAANNPSSGSVLYAAPFTGASGEQFMTFFTLANRWGWDAGVVIDATTYTNFSFDIKVDPSSPITPGGNYGNLESGLVTYVWNASKTNYDWGTINLNFGNIPLSATNWTHFNKAIDNTAAHIDRVVGFFIKMWSNGAHTNTLTFHLDNVGIQKPEAPVVIPPPTQGLAKAVPGLAFIAASAGQYDRQEIRTVGTNYTWIGASGPVSYSVNVAKVGENNPAGFQYFMHLVPGIPDPTRPDSDWHETNVVMLRVANNADGSAWCSLNYKTNSYEGNGHLYDTGSLGGVGNSTPVGTWTLTFNQDTNITITTPSGGTFQTNLPIDVVNIFKQTPNMQVNIGCVPGDLSRLGQMAVVTEFKTTGTPGEPNLDSNFLGVPRDTNVWMIVASSPNFGVQEIPTGAFWLNWTLPANGYVLRGTDKLTGGTWNDLALPGFEVGGKHNILVKQGDLPGVNSGFFDLVKRSATKLQILLPGETAAPGTPTGKTGTPTTQALYVGFPVTINAVDDTWHVIPTVSGDMIHLSSTTDQYTTFPADAALQNGTVTINDVFFTQPGMQNITASDVTNTNMANGTASVQVQ